MSVQYETIKITREIELPGIGVISGSSEVSVPQVGYSDGKDSEGKTVSVFDGLDVEEMLNVVEGKDENEKAENVVRHFNNGLKAALRSGAYASAGSLSAVEDSDDVKNLKKTLDSFVKNFGMSGEQAAAAVKGIPAIQAILDRLTEAGVLKAKS